MLLLTLVGDLIDVEKMGSGMGYAAFDSLAYDTNNHELCADGRAVAVSYVALLATTLSVPHPSLASEFVCLPCV